MKVYNYIESAGPIGEFQRQFDYPAFFSNGNSFHAMAVADNVVVYVQFFDRDISAIGPKIELNNFLLGDYKQVKDGGAGFYEAYANALAVITHYANVEYHELKEVPND